jgi:D-alanyl-D-alanine carboxypeptidase
VGDGLGSATAGSSSVGVPTARSLNHVRKVASSVSTVTGSPLAEAYRTDLFEPAGLERIAVQDTERPVPPLAVPPKHLHIGPADGYLPCRSVASSGGGTMAGIAADAPTVARWGYELYGALAVPAEIVQAMIKPQTEKEIFPQVQYGLGTEIFPSLQVQITPSVGHGGELPGNTTLLSVVPESHLSVALFVAEDNKDVLGIMRKILFALR